MIEKGAWKLRLCARYKVYWWFGIQPEKREKLGGKKVMTASAGWVVKDYSSKPERDEGAVKDGEF